MRIYKKNNKAFTLIELLVVVAIIGILSSVVLASLNSARGKAKDATIRAELREFEKLLQLEYNDTSSYVNLQSPCAWIPISQSCDNAFIGTYATQARAICKNILNNTPERWGASPNTYKFLVCNSVDNSQKYAIMAALNESNYWFCSGSSGVSDKTHYWDIPYPVGCYYNP